MKTLSVLAAGQMRDGATTYVTQQAMEIDPRMPLMASALRLRPWVGGIMLFLCDIGSRVHFFVLLVFRSQAYPKER